MEALHRTLSVRATLCWLGVPAPSPAVQFHDQHTPTALQHTVTGWHNITRTNTRPRDQRSFSSVFASCPQTHQSRHPLSLRRLPLPAPTIP
ncbi:hypothetical protein EDB83DRAFT_2411168 [Lactarius deliciosus]|nr:hypothetical protein EDB83DRAFT_2411168 [Lactarius deliciosus]